jgi:hypothetical protein
MNNAVPINETKEEKRARWDAEDRRRENSRSEEIHNTDFWHDRLTVAELIRILQTHDQNAVIEVKDTDGRFGVISNSDVDAGVRAQTGVPTVFIGN